MERTSSLRLLPDAHARALTLEAQGLNVSELAARLAIDPASVGPLLRVARAKLAALESLDERPNSTHPEPADRSRAGGNASFGEDQ